MFDHIYHARRPEAVDQDREPVGVFVVEGGAKHRTRPVLAIDGERSSR